MNRLAVVLSSVLFVAATAPSVRSQTKAEAPSFEQYQLVMLMAGPDRKERGSEEAAAIQNAHRMHLRKMKESGKMRIAGPFSDQWDDSFRGMCIYAVGSVEEARRLAESDPAVQGGQLRVEVMTWYVMAGRMVFPKLQPPGEAEKPKRKKKPYKR